MQRADPSSRVSSPDSRAAIRPATAFLLLLLLVAAVGAFIFLTRPAPAPTPGTRPATTPDFSLTNEEAISRFEELAEIRASAYATRDRTLLDSLYTSQSVVGPIASRELKKLAQDDVSDLSTYEILRLEVIANRAAEIRLQETVVVTPKFVDAEGSDITSTSRTTRETVVWTLRLEDGEWLIHDALVTNSRIIRAND